MSKNQKIVWWAVGVALVVIVVFAVVATRKPAGPATIKIGFTLPLTGDAAFLGEGAKAATEMAKADFGPTKFNYQFIYEDDQFKPEEAANTANKLIDVDKVNAIVSFGSPTGNVVSPIAEENDVIHFGIASDLTIAKGDYNFIDWTPPYKETDLLVSEFEKRGIKKVALFETNQPGVLAVTDDLKTKIVSTSIQFTTDQIFQPGETDFRSYISKAKVTGADIYLLEATTPELEILTKQIRDAGIKTPITSIESFEFSNQPSLFEGQWYIGPAVPSDAFAAAFKQKTGNNPTIGSPNMYDIVSLLMTAAEMSPAGHVPTQQELLSQLNSIKNFKGALGTLNFDPDGVVISDATVKEIKNGVPMVLEQ